MNIPEFDKQLIFILFLCLGVGFYLWKFIVPVHDYSLVTVKGELTETPYWSSTGGDFTYEYVKISLRDGNYFDLRNCAYEWADLDKINQLSVGDSIIFQVEDTLAREREYNVFSVSSSKTGSILTLEDFNKCNTSRWRVMYYVGAFICVILLTRYIVRSFKM